MKPGGTFYILDGHPVSHIFEPVESPDGAIELKPCHSYFPNPEGIAEEGGGYSYTGSEILETPSHEWQHSMSEIVNAIIDAGLTDRVSERIRRFRVPRLSTDESPR